MRRDAFVWTSLVLTACGRADEPEPAPAKPGVVAQDQAKPARPDDASKDNATAPKTADAKVPSEPPAATTKADPPPPTGPRAETLEDFSAFTAMRLPTTDVGEPLAGSWIVARVDAEQLAISGDGVMPVNEEGYLSGIPQRDGLYNVLLDTLIAARSREDSAGAGLLVVAGRRVPFSVLDTLQRSAEVAEIEPVALAVLGESETPATLRLSRLSPGAVGDPPDAEDRDAPRVVIEPNRYNLFAAGWRKDDEPHVIPALDRTKWVCDPARWNAPELRATAAAKLSPKKGSKRASIWADDAVPIAVLVDAIATLRKIDCDAAGAGCRFSDVVVQPPPPASERASMSVGDLFEDPPYEPRLGEPRARCASPGMP